MTKALRIAAVLMAIAALTVAAGCSGQKEEVPSEETAGETQPGVDAGIEQLASGVGIEPGQTPPPFTLADLEGNQVSLSDFEGSVVVLDLWATWCPPCKKEIPFLVTLYEEYKDQGLAVVGVGLDRGGASVLAPFVEANNISYTILVGDDQIGSDYKVSGIPMTLMIGRDGRVASKEVGFAPAMEEGMRSRVVELLGKDAPEA